MSAPPLKIGSLQLATNLLLAPIAGFTEQPFRRIVRGFGGVGLASTPLLTAQRIGHKHDQTDRLTARADDDRPLAFQIYGGEERLIAKGARWCADNGADLIDVNMGCPMAKVTRLAGGGRLMCDQPRALRLARAVLDAVAGRVPVTAKLRLGWDESSLVAPELAARLEELGIAAITVHGRTAVQKYVGQARLDGIAAVVAAVKSVPVIGNGDVRTPQDAAAMMQRAGCRGVMIGREALSAPWLFRDTWSYLTDGTIPAEPSLAEKLDVMRRHLRLMVEHREVKFGVLEFRKHVRWYARRIPMSSHLLERGRRLDSQEDFEQWATEVMATGSSTAE